MKFETACIRALPFMPISAVITGKVLSSLSNIPIYQINPKLVLAGGMIGYLSVLTELSHSGPEDYSRKGKFKYPSLTKDLLSAEPNGLVFGKDKKTGKYVCKSIDQRGIAHMLIIGGSGSGKSSGIIIPTLLAARKHVCVVLDIKSELSLKTASYADNCIGGHVCIVNPNNRSM